MNDSFDCGGSLCRLDFKKKCQACLNKHIEKVTKGKCPKSKNSELAYKCPSKDLKNVQRIANLHVVG